MPKTEPLDSHGVLVCPGWECGAPMERDVAAMTYTCVVGHVWTGEQYYYGDLKEPKRIERPVDPARLAYRVVIGEGMYRIIALPEGQREDVGVFGRRRRRSTR